MKQHSLLSPKIWLRCGMLAAFAFSWSLNLQAQTVPVIQWDKTIGSSDFDELHSLQQTTDGGYILGGWAGSGISGDKSQVGQGNSDYWVVKLDASGNKIWDKSFGGSMDDRLSTIHQTADGGYILGGTTYSGQGGDKSQASNGDADYWVVKLDASGNKIWDKTFGGSNADNFTSLQQTADGGYILGGRSVSGISGDKSQPVNGGPDYWVIKLDASGNKTWDKTYGSSSWDELYSLQQTSDGGYILGGSSGSGISGDKSQAGNGNGDYWVIKLDASGNKTWDKAYGGYDGEVLFSVQQTFDGGYVLGGTSLSGIGGDKGQPSFGGADYWVVKLDASGNKVWSRSFGLSSHDLLMSLQQTSDGGYILGGYSDKSQTLSGDSDYWVVKLDASGNDIWSMTLGGTGTDQLYSLQQTSDGGYIMGGYSRSDISGNKTQASKGYTDYWIVKLTGNVTGIKEAESGLGVSFYPNPSKGNIHLQLNDLSVPSVGVTVSDLLGRVVLQQELQVTNQRISQELTLPSVKGIYLMQVKAGEQITTCKIVVE